MAAPKKPASYDGLVVQIGPHAVTLKEEAVEGLYGKFEEMPYRVTISPTQTPVERACTVVHELLHAVEAIYGVQLGENKVRALESALVSAVIQNPDLIRLLAADLARA